MLGFFHSGNTGKCKYEVSDTTFRVLEMALLLFKIQSNLEVNFFFFFSAHTCGHWEVSVER